MEKAGAEYKKAGYPRGQVLCGILKAQIYFQSGSVTLAQKELSDADRMAKSLGYGEAVQLITLENARIYESRGDFKLAIENLTKLEKTPRLKFGLNQLNSRIFDLRGRLYFLMGDNAQAMNSFRKSIRYSRSLETQADAISRTGAYLGAMGRYTDAAHHFLRAVKLYNQMKMQRKVAAVFLEMARIYRKTGGYSQSLKLQQRSFELSGGRQSQLAPGILTGMGFNLLDEKKPEKALEKFNEALISIRAGGGENPRESWQADYGAARAFEAVGNDRKALDHYRTSVKSIEGLRREISSPESRSTFFQDKFPVYEGLIRLLLKNNLGSEAFHYSEASKARAFVEMLNTPRFEQVLNREGEDYRKLHRAKMQIASLRNRISTSQGDTSALQRQLDQTRTRLLKLTTRLKNENPRLASISGEVKPITAAKAKKLVRDSDTAMVEYFCGSDFVAAWIIDQKGVHPPVVIKTTREGLSRRISRLRRPITDLEQQSGGSLRGQVTALKRFRPRDALSLYKLIFEQVDREISKNSAVKRLVIIPDGPLHFYPFEALVTSLDGGSVKADGEFLAQFGRPSYLLEKYSVTYAPSLTSLDTFSRGAAPRGQVDLVVLGDPVYTREDMARHQGQGFTLAAADASTYTFLPLPNSLREVRTIAKLFSDTLRGTLVLDGPRAREGKARQSIGNGRYVHFSCHGILNQQSPMFSGLVLSQPQALGVTSGNDGFLEVYEIFNLEVNARLVVLSACQTGLGKYLSGEGVVGLARAFMYAGADQVVVSLWAVADESTSSLMGDFYREMLRKGLPPDKALQQAKLHLMGRASRSGVSYSHPFFWAPFVIMGRGGKQLDARGYGVISGAGGNAGGGIMAFIPGGLHPPAVN